MKRENRKVVRRSTSQRELVLEAVCNGNHLSAREIFVLVSQKKPMSFGTVYRNLIILEEEGEIVSIQTDPAFLRYDGDCNLHHHLYCKKCRKVFDMPISYNSSFDEEAAQRSGFIIDSHSISFEGLCCNCKDKY